MLTSLCVCSNKQTAKRQYSGSASPEVPSKQSNSVSQPASDDEAKIRASANGVKKTKIQTRNHHEKEDKGTNEVEPEHAESSSSSNRARGRSDRRQDEGELFHMSLFSFNLVCSVAETNCPLIS